MTANAPLRRRDWINKPARERVEILGHRTFVGGTDAEAWYGIGRRQYHYLVSQGLRRGNIFLDIACGSLRLGQYLIPFLDTGHYFGFEPERALIDAGLEHEILYDLAEIKKPVFGGNYDFNFAFIDRFDMALAQSLFTHLTLADIGRCFAGLAPVSAPDSRFFFTFFEGDGANNPIGPSHANKSWHYDFATLQAAAAPHGWVLEYIGDWQHERRQQMVVARRSSGAGNGKHG